MSEVDKYLIAKREGIEDLHALFACYLRDEEGFELFLSRFYGEGFDDDPQAAALRSLGLTYVSLWVLHGVLELLIKQIEGIDTAEGSERVPTEAVVPVWEMFMKKYKAMLGVEWTPPANGAY